VKLSPRPASGCSSNTPTAPRGARALDSSFTPRSYGSRRINEPGPNTPAAFSPPVPQRSDDSRKCGAKAWRSAMVSGENPERGFMALTRPLLPFETAERQNLSPRVGGGSHSASRGANCRLRLPLTSHSWIVNREDPCERGAFFSDADAVALLRIWG